MKLLRTLGTVLLVSTLSVWTASAQMSVVNGATFAPGQPVAPGSFASIFGDNLCLQTEAGHLDASGHFPLILGGCTVSVNGAPAMMHYASPGQINIIVPENAMPGEANIAVQNGQQILNGSMMISQSGPGVFSLNGFGMGEGAMLHAATWQTQPFSVTTNGEPTQVAIFMTGMDLSVKPSVSVGGVPAEVTFYGPVPGYPGLQQINMMLPPQGAGAGRVPVTVTSNGVVSNVTFAHLLPTNSMMLGMPGWGQGMMVAENMPRGREMSGIAFNPANNTVLVADENDDAVRVISLFSRTTVATITLPEDSAARAIAVNASGTMAAVVLSANNSVALIDLAQNKATAVIGTGVFPSHSAFSGSNLLVTNAGSGTVSVIDTNARTVTHEVKVGFGPGGIAISGNLAVVANMQGASLSLINLIDYSADTVALPPGSRPHEVAISAAANEAVVTMPTSDHVLTLNLTTKQVSEGDNLAWNAMGPGAVATNGSLAFIADQMTASVTVLDLNTGSVVKTTSVDPGPRSLAVDPTGNQLFVLAEGTGTLDVVDLTSYSVAARINAGDTERPWTWALPYFTSLAPSSAAAGSTFTLTINGSNLQSVKDIEFHFMGMQSGGMMGGGMGYGGEDPNINVSGINLSADGTRITATVQILASAAAGTRQIRLNTDQGEVMGPMFNSLFTVTQP